MKFVCSVKGVEDIFVAGICVKTTCKNAHIDCPQLWGTFQPLLQNIGESFTTTSTYGISCMHDTPESFTYWATLEVLPSQKLPSTLTSFTIPRGTYVTTAVSSIEAISQAITFIYSEWLEQHQEYSLAPDLPIFEKYTDEYHAKGIIHIYFPVKTL